MPIQNGNQNNYVYNRQLNEPQAAVSQQFASNQNFTGIFLDCSILKNKNIFFLRFLTKKRSCTQIHL